MGKGVLGGGQCRKWVESDRLIGKLFRMDFGEKHHPQFHKLLAYMIRVPSIEVNDTPWHGFGSGKLDGGGWWVKFAINIEDPLAWNVVQEFAHVLNYASAEERLPTVFKPGSPPPYLNGGPDEFLSWVIECPSEMRPGTVADWLEGRLPRPVDDPAQWRDDDDA